ncbi:MAG: hypothetical protein AAF739_09860 [Pseudomonadota bacterium]
MQTSNNAANAALGVLIILQLTMLMFLLAGLQPHPPRAIPLFAMGPFLGTSLAIAVAALICGPDTTRTGRSLSVVAAFCALLSYGPQKYFDPAIGEIWPAVVAGQIAAVTLLVLVGLSLRANARAQQTQQAV